MSKYQSISNIIQARRVLRRTVILSIYAIVLLAIAACSGGGGGGGGKGRTTKTGIRIIHAALDEAPMSFAFGEKIIQTAAFGDATFCALISSGPQAFSVFRANDPNAVLFQGSQDFVKSTEYTLFVSGEVRKNQFSQQLVAEAVARPEVGNAVIRLYNAYSASQGVGLQCGADGIAPIGRSAVSAALTVTAGPRICQVKLAGGGQLAEITLELADQSETALVVSGASDIGFLSIKPYIDLD